MQQELELTTLLPDVIDLAREAATAIMHVYDADDVDIQIKQDDSPVTAADLAANDIIIDGLRRLTPTIPIVSEESLKYADDRLSSRYVWMIDPVDGTKDFIKRSGDFTCNIALIDNGEPVLGVVAVPARDLLYYGATGSGGFKQIGNQPPIELTPAPARDEPIVAISTMHHSSTTTDWMEAHGLTKTLVAGSSLKICYVADHTVDVYPRLSPQTEWDIAAGDAVLRAAGGSLIEYETGQPMRYNKADLQTPYYIASNGMTL